MLEAGCSWDSGTFSNQSLILGRVPAAWKQANVAPVFKKGDRTDPNSYHPISVIPIMGKILECIVYQQTLHHLLKNNLLTSHISLDFDLVTQRKMFSFELLVIGD